MSEIGAILQGQMSAMAAPEVIAVLFALFYLVLAIRQNIWCWYCAAISTAFFVYVYFSANLYMESVLNVFYFGMAIYGWYKWRPVSSGKKELPVSVLSRQTHVLAVVCIMLISATSGYFLSSYTDAAFPYIDSATTFAAIWATYLVARKVLENWWYWLLIDIASVFIYWSRDLELTSILFVLYVALIPIGLVSWTRSYRLEQGATAMPA
ncbi:MAG: nicotinamide mononucleotide transporter [Woeseiaceae bacterium]|jgi:nicotinamide mononucleotide transporter